MHVNKQMQRTFKTRGRLEKSARRLFEKKGYGEVSAEDIVAAAKVTRGALYHHYDGKDGLFAAVVERAMRELHEAVREDAREAKTPFDGLKRGVRSFLVRSEHPGLRRLLFLDAPAALGWSRWREMDARYGLGMLQAAIEAATGAGLMRKQPAKIAAHLLLSAMIEGALLIAASSGEKGVRAGVEAGLLRMIEAMA